MKCLFTLLFLSICSLSFSQLTPAQMDSARNASMRKIDPNNEIKPLVDVKISDELFYIRENAQKYHLRLGTATMLQFMGVIVATGGYLAAYNTNPKIASGALIVGGGFMFLGSMVQLNARKYLGRIGIGVAGNGVRVRYVF